jgi:hypothetical protein
MGLQITNTSELHQAVNLVHVGSTHDFNLLLPVQKVSKRFDPVQIFLLLAILNMSQISSSSNSDLDLNGLK